MGKNRRLYIAASSDYDIARIIKTDIIIIYCGDDMEAVLNSLGTGPVTVYLQGDCMYKSTETGMGPLRWNPYYQW
jgi:hypothetical protein